MPPRSPPRPPRPLDADRLQDLALHYAGRYATTRAKLTRYLQRKLRERGWDDAGEPDVPALVQRLAELRYVDDATFATMKAGAMQRRWLGERRIAQALAVDGVGENDRTEAVHLDDAARWAAADRLARRKRIGPYAGEPASREQREKQIASFLRAGHDMATTRAWVDALPGEPPETPA